MQVPVKGQALLDYARRDKVFRQLRLIARPNSQDADMMAGADELLLLYRKYILERSHSDDWEQSYPWTWDMNSKVYLRLLILKITWIYIF